MTVRYLDVRPFAERVRRATSTNEAMHRLQTGLRAWGVELVEQRRILSKWEDGRREHFARFREEPQLTSNRDGPPNDGWVWDVFPRAWAKKPGDLVWGWTPPELATDHRPCDRSMVQILKGDDGMPDCCTCATDGPHPLTRAEKFAVVAAIHDSVFRGVCDLSLWVDKTVAGGDDTHATDIEVAGADYANLINAVQRLPEGRDAMLAGLVEDVLRDVEPQVCTEDGQGGGAATKRRKSRRTKWLAEAMLTVQENPELPDCDIAKLVGVAPSTLSRDEVYRLAAKTARDQGRNQAKPAFTKGRDGRTDLDAVNKDDTL